MCVHNLKSSAYIFILFFITANGFWYASSQPVNGCSVPKGEYENKLGFRKWTCRKYIWYCKRIQKWTGFIGMYVVNIRIKQPLS